MVVCAAAKCSNSSRIKNMRFFKFPSEEQRRKLWIENSSLPNEPGPYAKLCEVHFEESQFELHRQDGWRKLKPNAIPTVYPEPSQTPKARREKTSLQKRRRSPSPEDSDIEVDVPPNVPPLKIVRRKKRHDVATDKKKFTHKKNGSRNSAESSKSSQKENVSPRRRKGRPRKVSTPEPESSSSETEVDYELEDPPEYTTKTKDTEEQERQLASLKRENESMRQEIQEFEKHNKAMSRVIMELEKHNKAMSAKLQELDKDNKVMSKKLGDLEKQNEDLRAKLNCCFSEEQFQRMEKLMALGKIERYIPGIK